jgi:phospholipase/carboxylesterase
MIAFAIGGAGCGGCSSKPKKVATASKMPPPPKVPKPPPLPPVGPDGFYDTGGLHYMVVLTGGAKMADKLPIVVDLHGGGGHAEVHGRDNVPDKARFVIPNGYYPAPRGGGFEWYPKGVSGAWSHAELARDLPPVTEKLAKSLAAVVAAWPTEGKITITGHSQGGMLSYALSLFHPELIGWACPLAGQVPPMMMRTAHPVAPFPEVHGFHGQEDRVVSIADANTTIQTLRRLGYTADLKPYHGGHGDADLVAPDMAACISKGIRRAHRI